MVAGRVSNYTRSCLTAHALPWSSSSSSSDVGGRWSIPAGRPGRIELAVLGRPRRGLAPPPSSTSSRGPGAEVTRALSARLQQRLPGQLNGFD